MFYRMNFLKLLLLPVLASPLSALAHPTYKVRMAAASITGDDLINVGDVVGITAGNAAIWSGTSVTAIAAMLPPSRGFGMNNRGHIVGIGVKSIAFVYSTADGVRDISFSDPYTEFSWAVAVNDAGYV